MLIASAALLAVFAFVRIEFPGSAAPPNPAWAPSEAEGMKLGGPQEDKGAPAVPAPVVIPNKSIPTATAPPRRAKVTVVSQQPGLRNLSATPAPAASASEPSETPAAPVATSAAGDTTKDVLDAEPPPPGATASGRKPEEEKPLHKRLFRAVGKIFKGKKTEPKVEPSAHSPQQP